MKARKEKAVKAVKGFAVLRPNTNALVGSWIPIGNNKEAIGAAVFLRKSHAKMFSKKYPNCKEQMTVVRVEIRVVSR